MLDRGAIAIYLREISAYPRVNRELETLLATRAREGDRHSRDHLIRCNLYLVVRLCRERLDRAPESCQVGLEELVAEGNLALTRAADSFVPGQGYRFSTHVRMCVLPAIRDYLCHHGGRRLPYSHDALAEINRYNRTAEALAIRDGIAPTFDQVVEAMGLTPRERREMSLKLQAARFDSRGRNEDPSQAVHGPVTAVPDRNPSPADLAELRELLGRLGELLDRIDPEDAEVIRDRFGLDGREPRNQADIARDMDLSKSTIGNIERQALRRMANELGAD